MFKFICFFVFVIQYIQSIPPAVTLEKSVLSTIRSENALKNALKGFDRGGDEMKRMFDVENQVNQVNQANQVGLSRLFFDEHSEHGMGKLVSQFGLDKGLAANVESLGLGSAHKENIPIDKAALKSSFVAEHQLLEISQVIPFKQSETAVRFMTFNVENLKKLDQILSTIVKADPDVFVMQEVPQKSLAKMIAHLKEEGYSHFAQCMNFRIGAGMLGNVIFSKYPIKSSNSYGLVDLYGRRCLVEALISAPAGDVLAMGTHLSNKGSNFRAFQMDKISELSKERQALGFRDQVLMADMNAKQDEIAKTTISSVFTDSFGIAGQKAPDATQWRGNRIDFVMMSPSLADKNGPGKTNALLVNSGASDHVPILADVELRPVTSVKSGKKESTQNDIAQLPKSAVFDLLSEKENENLAKGVGLASILVSGVAASSIINGN